MPRWAAILALLAAVSARAERARIFYDSVENGRLTGGRLVVDLSDPAQRDQFGADLPAGFRLVVWPVATIRDNGPSDNRVDLVILGDGYTASQMATYATHVGNVVTPFFSQEPLAAYAKYFNVHRVDVASNQSGVDEVDLGIYKDTALDMAYGCFGIDRLLCINVSKAYAAAASAPAVDQILALANSTRYGGAGYPDDDLGTLAGNNISTVELALHEFGHSFADLADEYDYGGEPTYSGPGFLEPNVSIYNAANIQARHTKWFRWLDLAAVDAFQGGAYHQFGVYRPTNDSKMRNLNRPFQEVNVEQFVMSLYRSVSVVDDATPPSADPLFGCGPLSVTLPQPVGHSLAVQWYVNGDPVAGAVGTTFVPADGPLVDGVNTVSVIVVDPTTRVRNEGFRAARMTFTRSWPVAPGCPEIGSGACCSPEAPYLCTDGVLPTQCLGAGGTFRGTDTQCAAIDCDRCHLPNCQWCWIGTEREGDCERALDGDGSCDCGCQFTDRDCFCGDGSCLFGEDACSCPDDCEAFCGDSCCSHEERGRNCPLDCLDLRAFDQFARCFTGPDLPRSFWCQDSDYEEDGDVDMEDYNRFRTGRFGGP